MPDLSLNDDKAYAAESEKLARLNAERSELDASISEVARERAALQGSNRLDGAAVALLDGEEAGADARGPEQRLVELTQRREVLGRAIGIQTERANRARVEAGARIVRKLGPDYDKLINRVVVAAVELAKACDAAWIFRDELTNRGVSIGWFQPLTGVSLRDPNSRLNVWLGEAERSGLDVKKLLKGGNGRRAKK